MTVLNGPPSADDPSELLVTKHGATAAIRPSPPAGMLFREGTEETERGESHLPGVTRILLLQFTVQTENRWDDGPMRSDPFAPVMPRAITGRTWRPSPPVEATTSLSGGTLR